MAGNPPNRQPFTLDGFRVQPERLTIIDADGGESRITPRAMAVLLTLAQADGEVVRKQDLLDAVWPRMDVTEGVLSQTILELRNVFLDDARAPHFIETIRGIGFRLIPAPAAEPDLPDPSRMPASRWAMLLTLGACVVALTVWLVLGTAEAPDPPRIMITPFENLSPNQDYDYFAQGMADEIALQLAGSAELRIISEKALRGALESGMSARDAARQLDVDLILTGSVQRRGDTVNLLAELVDVASADQLWVSRFERPLDDIFAVQDEVAAAIARIVIDERPLPGRVTRTRNLSAYDLYLRGRAELKSLRATANERAIKLFERALQIDPGFAAARASLAEALASDGFLFQRGDASLHRALAEAETVIADDPSQANAHYARALALMGLARFRLAERAIQNVISSSPNYVDALFLAGQLAENRGQIGAAKSAYEQAVQLDPTLSRTVAFGRLLYLSGEPERGLTVARRGHELAPGAPTLYLAHLLNLMGRSSEAESLCKEALEMQIPRSLNLCGFVALFAGDRALAQARLEQSWAAHPGAVWAPFVFAPAATPLAWLAMQRSDRQEATRLLTDSEAVTTAEIGRGNDHFALRYNLASIAALRGREREALDWLERAYAEGFRDYRLLEIDPTFGSLRSSGTLDTLVDRIRGDFGLSEQLAGSGSAD